VIFRGVTLAESVLAYGGGVIVENNQWGCPGISTDPTLHWGNVGGGKRRPPTLENPRNYEIKKGLKNKKNGEEEKGKKRDYPFTPKYNLGGKGVARKKKSGGK